MVAGQGSIYLAAALVAAAAVSAHAGERTLDAALAAAAGHDVVIVGEVHDNPAHQAGQAAAAAALQPKALVFEMIEAAAEDDLARLRAQGASLADVEAALDWATSGWPPFDRYAASLEAAPEAAVFGAWVTRQRFGTDDPELAALETQFALDTPLPPDQQAAREALQAASHCNILPDEVLPRMVAAQRLRDAALADAVLRAAAVPGDGPILVITGNGHARTDWGLPAVLAAAAPTLSVFAIGQYEGEVADAPVDVWRRTEPVDRPHPCAAFREG